MKVAILIRRIAVWAFIILLIVTFFFGGPSGGIIERHALPAAPTASFSVNVNQDDATKTVVTADATSSRAGSGFEIKNYIWDFGDGSPVAAAGAVNAHEYTKNGTYTVKLKVTQNNGLFNEATQYVTVSKIAPAAATEPAPPPPPTEACPGSYQVKLFPNDGGNILPENYLSHDPETARQQLAEAAKMDPRVLQTYYNPSPLGKLNPIANTTDIAPIQDGACYTELGKKAYDEWVILLKVAKLSPDALPHTGTNTGAVPHGPAYQETGLIPDGDGMRVEYVDADGNVIIVHHIRLQCGNVVTTYEIILALKPEGAPSIVTPPPATSSENPSPSSTPTPGTTTPSTPDEHKDPSWDPQNRSNVPPAAVLNDQGDTHQDVSRGAAAPVETGNGIPAGATTGAAAPRSTPAPASTHISGPSMDQPTEPAAPPSTTAVQTVMPAEPPPPPAG